MGVSVRREADMNSMTQFAILVAATGVAGATAFGLAWAFLLGAFRLMQPATVRTQARPVRLDLVEGTRAAARQLVRS
jgi:hypothetical protein